MIAEIRYQKSKKAEELDKMQIEFQELQEKITNLRNEFIKKQIEYNLLNELEAKQEEVDKTGPMCSDSEDEEDKE